MLSRRATLMASALPLILSACRAADAEGLDQSPLKSRLPYPLAVAVQGQQLANPNDAALIARHFSRLTPEWELKMEAVLSNEGDLDFSRPDRIFAFAKAKGLAVFGHNLVWYAQTPWAFNKLSDDPAAFEAALNAYIATVVGRYGAICPGWDVVNEAISDDDSCAVRGGIWKKVLGERYIDLAYRAAHAAAPQVPLFLNDYNLDSNPNKRRAFLRLAERLLKDGVPLSGLGTQTHINADLAPAAVRDAIRDLGGLGLPVHVSELDISINRCPNALLNGEALRAGQVRLVEAVLAAIHALRPEQRFGLTIWGLRDDESWLNRGGERKFGPLDAPLLFDEAGRLKPLSAAVRG